MTNNTRNLTYKGVVHYDEHLPDPGNWVSDVDFYGYNEFVFMSDCETWDAEGNDVLDETEQENTLFHALLNAEYGF